MPENFSNRYTTALAAGVTSGAATGTVTSVTGVPAYPFRAIISAEGANTDEIVLVTLVAGTTLTWTRAAEAVAGVQAASAHGIGATFTAIVTAVGLLNIGRLDIRSFGATTTSADNAVAIQAALDEQKASGGIVYIPEGTFLTSPLTYVSTGQTLHILGAGRDRSILKPKSGTGTVLTLSGPLALCSFRDFQIDGTGGTGHGLYYSGTSSPDWLSEGTFENLLIQTCALTGLYIKNSFANRYVNIYAGFNGLDQIKVWGGPADYYQRIDIGSTYAGYAGLRCIDGGTFDACNGIYDTVHAAGPMFKFGGDGTAESDSITRYPRVKITGSNVEAFTTTGILFVNSPNQPILMDAVMFQTGSGVANCVAISEDLATTIPLVMSGCQFSLIGGATWLNGYAIHGELPGFADASDGAGMPTGIWSAIAGYWYAINQLVYGVSDANAVGYLYRKGTLQGYTEIAYLASVGLGNIYLGTGFVHRTASPTMPTSGTYLRGDIVDNCSNTISEAGAGGSKYTVIGWRRLTAGSAHVLNTDWVERRELTGN